MSGTFKAHLSSLPAEQLRLWPHLKSVSNLGFVLYGGTAIALRLGHRTSIDFDFFSDRPLNRDSIWDSSLFMTNAAVLQDEVNTLTVLVNSGDLTSPRVKVSYFGGIGFGRVDNPSWTEDGVLQVASLNDLMATKLKVILQRAEAKDYRDIEAMILGGVSLAHALSSARVLFGNSFQPSEGLRALSYFVDGDLKTLPKNTKRILVKAAASVGALPNVGLVSKFLAFEAG